MRTQLLPFFVFFAILSSLPAQNLLWHHHFYSKEYSRNLASTLDPEANFYTTGYIGGPNEVGTTLGQHLLNPEKGQFLYKLDSTGHPVWAKMILRGNVKVEALESDSTGNLFVAGFFTGAVDFDPGPADSTVSTLLSRMYFLQKLDTAGNLIWAKQFSTGSASSSDNLTSLDPEGNVLVTGDFSGTVDFDPGSGVHTITAVTLGSQFFLKLDNDGNFLWVKQIGQVNFISAIHSDRESNWIMAGSVVNTQADMDPGPDTFYQDPGRFILKLNAQGGFEWVQSFAPDSHPKIAIDADGNIFMVGPFKDTVDFDPGPGEAVYTAFDDEQAFIMKWNSAGKFLWVRIDPRTQQGIVESRSVAAGPNGSVSVMGYYHGGINLIPDWGMYWLTSSSLRLGLVIQTLDAAGQWQSAMDVSNLNQIFNKYEYHLRYDAKGDLYVRTTCSGWTQFDLDTNNVQFIAAHLQSETDQLIFKVTVPYVPLVSGSTDLPAQTGVVLFPNPTSAYAPMFIKLPDTARPGATLEIHCWDARGVLVQHHKGKVTPGVVHLPGLPQGKYAVRVRSGDMVYSNWWVVE